MVTKLNRAVLALIVIWLLLIASPDWFGGATFHMDAQISGGEVAAAETPAFNVVLIVIDTLRADHLPFQGYPIDTAPFLHDLSTSSAVFDNAQSTSSWTAPATASLFTSLYPIQHGVVTGMEAYERLREKNPEITLNRIPDKLTVLGEVF